MHYNHTVVKQLHSDTHVTADNLVERADVDGEVHPPSATRLPQFQKHQRNGSAEGVKEKFKYGTRKADQAAQLLQSLGALVYPPAKGGTLDWGILAGATPLPSAYMPAHLFV